MMTRFTLTTRLDAPQNPLCDEHLFDLALTSGPQAWIWQSEKGLVVPRSYAQTPAFDDCQYHFATQGWPISVRQSGGGIVPQGPGIWNVSLAWRQYGKPLDLAENAYIQLCTPIQQALSVCGLYSDMQAVQGSFCDGRFNLAVQHQAMTKKIVGTAQVWRRCAAPTHMTPIPRQAGDPAGWHVVLAHALVLMDIDIKDLSQRANEVEQYLDRPARYQAQRICDLTTLGIEPQPFLSNLQTQLGDSLVPHDLASTWR